MRVIKYRSREAGRVRPIPATPITVLATTAAACLFFLLTLPLWAQGARAQEETPPIPQTPGEGVSQAGQVYFYLDGELAPVPREVAGGPQAVEFTVMELLNGPKEEEKAQGYVTYIPEGVKLQYTTVKQDRSEFSVNFSRELLQLSGDRESALKALAQVVKTVREASQIEKIGVTVSAEESGLQPEDAFQALGVSARDVEAEISGTSPSGGGGRLWLVLLLALGIPVLALIAALAFLFRKKASNPGEVKPVVGTAARPTLRVKRRRGASPPPPAPWKEPRSKRKGRKRGKNEN